MILRQSGKIDEDFYVLLNPEIPMYLLGGDSPACIDAGFACLGPAYEKELHSILNGNGPASMLFTHAHYDHCGSAAYLKERFPEMQCYASPLSEGILARPKVVDVIRMLNKVARDMMCKQWNRDLPDIEFQPFSMDHSLSEGDHVRISKDCTIQAIETPGHTRDCLSYYVPERKILFTSEAAGIVDVTGYIYCDFLVDYPSYWESLVKLSKLEVETVCLGHGCVLTGEDAKTYLGRAMEHCQDFRALVENLIEDKKGDLKAVMGEVRKTEYDPKPHPKQPEPAYMLNLEARVRAVQKVMDQ